MCYVLHATVLLGEIAQAAAESALLHVLGCQALQHCIRRNIMVHPSQILIMSMGIIFGGELDMPELHVA